MERSSGYMYPVLYPPALGAYPVLASKAFDRVNRVSVRYVPRYAKVKVKVIRPEAWIIIKE